MIPAEAIDPDVGGRPALLRRAGVGAIVVVLLAAVLTAWGRGAFADEISVSALLDDAGGSLTTGSDVKSRGVIIGRVSAIEAAGDHVRVTMSVDGEQARRVATSVTARVLPATVFGTTFVDLVPNGSGGHLRHGAVIAQTLDSKTLELQDTLDSTDRVLGSVQPAELASTLHAVANALDGRGSELGETIDLSEAYLARLEPKLPLIREDLALAAKVFGVLNASAPDLLTAVRDARPSLKTLDDKSDEIDVILGRSTKLFRTSDDFFRAYRAIFERAIHLSAMMFAALFDNRAGFPDGLKAFARFAETASGGIDGGPWLDTDVFFKVGDDIPYTSADCPTFGSAPRVVYGANCSGAN